MLGREIKNDEGRNRSRQCKSTRVLGNAFSGSATTTFVLAASNGQMCISIEKVGFRATELVFFFIQHSSTDGAPIRLLESDVRDKGDDACWANRAS